MLLIGIYVYSGASRCGIFEKKKKKELELGCMVRILMQQSRSK